MAQSEAATGALDNYMQRLAAFEPVDLPVISVYLNAQADQHGRQDFDRFLRKTLGELAKTYAPHTPERESFDRDVERITKYVADEVRPETNGVALFACAGADEFFEAIQLEAPIEDHRVYVYNQPHLYPLARLMDQYPRYAVLVCDTNRARLFVFGRGKTLNTEEIQNVKTNRSQAGGWSQMRYQRHLENYHLHHAKEVVETLARVVAQDKIEHVILAGDEQIIPILREQLPKQLGEKIVDVLSLDINAPEHEVLAASMESMTEHDEQTDAEKVERLINEYRAGGLACVGAQDTLEALSMGQVDELFLSASMRQIEGDRDDVAILSDNEVVDPLVSAADPAANNIESDSVIVADELVTRAQQTSARVTFVEDASLLEEFGGVGAILRFRIDRTPDPNTAPQPANG
ncbi:MAG TPA: Vms1/Ankzf1 family peptidyl-tRNA hydrolase [Pyrinomonadaceae bacterium]|nr:Vms1/Ankzf1 family peptidyl-tRNA hydrolase [Pyrinomonadaceae bacterium]